MADYEQIARDARALYELLVAQNDRRAADAYQLYMAALKAWCAADVAAAQK